MQRQKLKLAITKSRVTAKMNSLTSQIIDNNYHLRNNKMSYKPNQSNWSNISTLNKSFRFCPDKLLVMFKAWSLKTLYQLSRDDIKN